jgi:hypothetical protein
MDEPPTGVAAPAADAPGVARLEELRVSARGWHGVQLAVLGFIGLCGVLQTGGSDDRPRWLQVLSGILVLGAFGLACVATVLVAIAAWPVYAADRSVESEGEATARTGARLRTGIVLTFVAVAVLALATSSAWWPSRAAGDDGTSPVEVRTRTAVVCGDLAASPEQEVLAVSAGGQVVKVNIAEVVSVRPVQSCA